MTTTLTNTARRSTAPLGNAPHRTASLNTAQPSTGTVSVRIRPLAESRPPAQIWQPTGPSTVELRQPALDLGTSAVDRGKDRQSGDGVQVTVVRSRWCAKASPRLPDPRGWSASLALALVEALHGHRPIAQLNRWVDEDVLAAISLHRRRRRADQGRVAPRPALRSVRLQHPSADVTEASAHLSIGRRSIAIAFRLEAAGERWLCTAAEFGPRG